MRSCRGGIYAPFLVQDRSIDSLLDSDLTNDPNIFFPYSGVCAGEGQIRRLKPLLSKGFSVLTRLNTAIFRGQ
jgi:hypothetical protein